MAVPSNEHERTLALAEIALEQIRALRQPASPRNYEIWYQYATGYYPDLNKSINDTLAQKGQLSDPDDHGYLTPSRATGSTPSARAWSTRSNRCCDTDRRRSARAFREPCRRA